MMKLGLPLTFLDASCYKGRNPTQTYLKGRLACLPEKNGDGRTSFRKSLTQLLIYRQRPFNDAVRVYEVTSVMSNSL